MNKYDKNIEDLENEYDNRYREYEKDFNKILDEQRAARYKLNDQINVINGIRQDFQKQITDLYNFLKRFGNIGVKISPFDFVTEYTVSDESKPEPRQTIQKPAGGGIFHLKKSKEAALSAKDMTEKQYSFWEESKDKAKGQTMFYENAHKMADTYRSLIKTIEESIRVTILPELSGIEAFLIADAIRESVIYGTDPQDVEIENISDYEGTSYNEHFIFIRNTFDYYNIISKFYKERVLYNILKDGKITPQEKEDFEKKVAEINSRTNELVLSAKFGGALSLKQNAEEVSKSGHDNKTVG